MKIIKIYFIILILSYQYSNSQWVQFTFPSSVDWMSKPSFYTAESGFIFAGSGQYPYYHNFKLCNTTNKGINWSSGITLPDYVLFSCIMKPEIYFLNGLTGFIVYEDAYNGPRIQILKTQTAGQGNWESHTVSMTNWSLGNLHLYFLNEQTGFVSNYKEVYRTLDGCHTWTKIFFINDYINDIDANVSDIAIYNNTIYIGGGINRQPFVSGLYRSLDNGNTFSQMIEENSNNPVGEINSLSLINQNNTLNVKCSGFWGIGTEDDNYNPPELLNLGNPYDPNLFLKKDIIFTNNNTGYVYAYSYNNSNSSIGRTIDQGSTWTQNDFSLNNFLVNGILNIGDIVIASATNSVSPPTSIILNRKININGQYYFDNTPGNYSGTWSVNDLGSQQNFSVPGNCDILGGLLFASGPENIINNGNEIFYKWENNGMNTNNNKDSLIHTGDALIADYKSKLISTSINACSPATQVKALKDTNNVVNLCYESMGGIFYTRSNNDWYTFNTEEIVNYTPYENSADNNYNPCIAEIKNFDYNHPYNDQIKNVAAVWEKREGLNVKIRFSERLTNTPPYSWSYPKDLVTITNVPNGFNCYPKLFMNKSPNNNGYDSVVCVLYLNPNNGGQLWMYAVGNYFSTNYILNPTQVITDATGNGIKSFSATYLMYNYYPNNFSLDIHITYAQNNKIHYNRGKLLIVQNMPLNFYLNMPNEYKEVSDNLNLQTRSNPDISLRNANDLNGTDMEPVISYQGQKTVMIQISGNSPGKQQQISITYSSIVDREKLYTINNGYSWSGYVQYSSPPNVPQGNPCIEGSKSRNSYILNFFQNYNNFVELVPRWNGTPSGNHFQTPSISALDAKFVRSALIDANNNSQWLITLNNPYPYQVGIVQDNFTSSGGGTDEGTDAINGVASDENNTYSFCLGDIMVNSQLINFDYEMDSIVDNTNDFNSSLSSNVFALHENDTLVVGRNVFYLPQDTLNPFQEVLYSLKLIDNTTGKLFSVLEQDTIHVNDTVQIEYLDGFIINNIPNEMDSFYVQLEVDTLRDFTDYTLTGTVGGFGSLGGDAVNLKRYINFRNIKLSDNMIPTKFELYQNYPNPFNPTTKIKFDIPKNENVTLKIYDILGRLVTTLVNDENKNAGRYVVDWNASNYASGIYFYRIQAGNFVSVKKMILVK